MRQLEGVLMNATNFRSELMCKDENRQPLTVFWDCPPDRVQEMKLGTPTRVRVTFVGDSDDVDDVEVLGPL